MNIPRHVSIIMDGNGRWAKRRLLPRVAGHRKGVESVRAIVSACLKKNISFLTLFTFSSENWSRPKSEVDFLFDLILQLLQDEVKSLCENGVCLKIIGDKTTFSKELREAIRQAETLTSRNTKLRLNIAFNYGGRWDMIQAVQQLGHQIAAGDLKADEISESLLNQHLVLSDCPEPDLFIRTSGEYRISNFLLWQLAYTELYFTKTFWPDFREAQFEEALKAYSARQRRFGHTEEQNINASDSNSFLKWIERKVHA